MKINFCRLTCFGDYSRIEYSKDAVLSLSNLIPNYFPSLVQESIVDELGPRNLNRIQLRTPDGLRTITILSNRIDVERRYAISEMPKDNLNDIETMKQEMTIILNSLQPNLITKSFRLAYFVSYYIFDMPKDKYLDYCKKFLTIPKFYNDCLRDEFIVRYVGSLSKIINGTNQDINAITTINKIIPIVQNEKVYDGYSVSFDINTSPVDNSFRFGPQEFIDFVEIALDIKKEMIGDFLW